MAAISLVSIVVPTYRRPAFLEDCLARIASQRPGQPFETLVVDDGSADETREVVLRYQGSIPRLRYLHQSNAGAGAARNNGARQAVGDLLVFIDDDILVEPDHLERHVAAHLLFPRCAVNAFWEFSPGSLALLQATPFGRFRLDVEHWYWQSDRRVEPLDHDYMRGSTVVSWNLSMKRADYWDVGGFDKTLPNAGLEDQEFSVRCLEAGILSVVDPGIRLLQNEAFATLDSFCVRRQRGAFDTVCAARVRPDVFANRAMIRENSRPRAGDSVAVVTRKLLRALAATPLSERLLRLAIALLERVSPNTSLLRRAYWRLAGIYIFRGIRQGLASPPPVPVHEEA